MGPLSKRQKLLYFLSFFFIATAAATATATAAAPIPTEALQPPLGAYSDIFLIDFNIISTSFCPLI